MATAIVSDAAAKVTRKFGTKQIFLPNFTLTLLRTPKLPPTFATFIVPLNLNKLDLRDYLYHGYGLQITGVRSYIQMQKLRQDKPGAKRPSPRKWFRPRSIKRMTVEMTRPFVWPTELKTPEQLEKWDKTTFDAAQKERTEQEEGSRPDARQKPSKDREPIAEQAKAILRGDVKWKPQNDEWVDDGEEVEVETDVTLPNIER